MSKDYDGRLRTFARLSRFPSGEGDDKCKFPLELRVDDRVALKMPRFRHVVSTYLKLWSALKISSSKRISF